MDNRKNWLTDRQRGIGASESSALFGVNPWASPMSVYASKVVPIDQQVDTAGEAAFWGSRLERIIIDVYAERAGRTIWRHDQSVCLSHPEFNTTRMIATPDAFDATAGMGIEELELVEVKTCGAHLASHWLCAPPIWYQVQVQHQMAVTGLSRAVIVVLIGGQELRWYEIERYDRFISVLEDCCSRFWHDHVEPRIEPDVDDLPVTNDALVALHPFDSGETIKLDKSLIDSSDRLSEIDDQIKSLNTEKEKLRNEIKQAIGDATFGIIDGYRVKWSWRHQERKGATFRVLRRGKV